MRRKVVGAQNGFSFIELLVVLSIMGVLGAIAGLYYRSTESSFDRMNARSMLLQDLKRAQAETITWGCRGIFAVADAGRQYSYGCDFLDYDVNDPPAADRVFFSRRLPTGISFSPSRPIIFNSRGLAVDQEGIMINVTVDLQDTKDGAASNFARGLLLGTGVFSYTD